MIRGYLLTSGGRRRPFVKAVFQFPGLRDGSVEVDLLVDTGADRTVLSPLDAEKLATDLGIDFSSLPRGTSGAGVGGQVDTRIVEAVITLDSFSTSLTLTILEPPVGRPIPSIPSLLGRDIISQFALILEERTNRVLLLEPHEADALALPS